MHAGPCMDAACNLNTLGSLLHGTMDLHTAYDMKTAAQHNQRHYSCPLPCHGQSVHEIHLFRPPCPPLLLRQHASRNRRADIKTHGDGSVIPMHRPNTGRCVTGQQRPLTIAKSPSAHARVHLHSAIMLQESASDYLPLYLAHSNRP